MRVSSQFFNLPKGEPMCVIAPKKSGKTTLVCMLAVKLAKKGKRVTIIVANKPNKNKALDIIKKLQPHGGCENISVITETRQTILDNVDVVLVDDAGHIDPTFMYDVIFPQMIAKPDTTTTTTLMLIESPGYGSEINYFKRLCKADDDDGPIKYVINVSAANL